MHHTNSDPRSYYRQMRIEQIEKKLKEQEEELNRLREEVLAQAFRNTGTTIPRPKSYTFVDPNTPPNIWDHLSKKNGGSNLNSYLLHRKQAIDKQIAELQKERQEIDPASGVLPFVEKPLWNDHSVYCVNQKGERTAVWVTAPWSTSSHVPIQQPKSTGAIQKTTPRLTPKPKKLPYGLLWIAATLLIGLLFVTCQANRQPSYEPSSTSPSPAQTN